MLSEHITGGQAEHVKENLPDDMTMRTSQNLCSLGIDLGGTNVRAGVIDHGSRTLSRVKRRSRAELGPRIGIDNLLEVAREAIAEAGLTLEAIGSVGLASAGPMDFATGRLLYPPNLPGWEDTPIRDEVAANLKRPVTLLNDASAAAYGEYQVRGGDGHSLLLWTLGTGIGAGLVLQGKILEGAHSHGSECGHMIIDMNSQRELPGTGQCGTVESICSARSLVARCREALEQGSPSSLRNASADQLTARDIGEAAESGDDLAYQLVMETARALGVATTSMMHAFDPEVVLFGGGMTFGRHETALGRRFLERIVHEVHQRTFPRLRELTKLDYAQLGGDAGFVGAARWACCRAATAT